jgi:hypothetical protein
MVLGLTQCLREMYTREHFWGLERGRRVRLTISPSVSRLSRWCMIPNVLQSYRHLLPVTDTDLQHSSSDALTLMIRYVMHINFEMIQENKHIRNEISMNESMELL